jgi:hypothetical protein
MAGDGLVELVDWMIRRHEASPHTKAPTSPIDPRPTHARTHPSIHPQPQGEFVSQLAELVIKNYGASHGLKKSDVYVIENKKKRSYFDEEDLATA